MKKHFEWIVLLSGLVIIAIMNPYIDNGTSFCLFENLGVPFCPGEGLAHSISFVFRGDIHNALEANIMGPFAILIIAGRVGTLWYKNFINS